MLLKQTFTEQKLSLETKNMKTNEKLNRSVEGELDLQKKNRREMTKLLENYSRP